jgi:hypothetical protein
MDDTQNNEGDIISVSEQIDYILQNLDVVPLPGHVVATLCQSRRYIQYLEAEVLQNMAQPIQNEIKLVEKNEN